MPRYTALAKWPLAGERGMLGGEGGRVVVPQVLAGRSQQTQRAGPGSEGVREVPASRTEEAVLWGRGG